MKKQIPKREGIMLAHPLTERRLSKLGKEFFCQPKLRGERCRVRWFHGEPILLSSYGNQFMYLDHIQKALTILSEATGEVAFDGALYVHGWSQERINSACNRKVSRNPDSQLMEYHIFDTQEDRLPQIDRLVLLRAVEKITRSTHPLIMVDTSVTSPAHVIDVTRHYTGLGYEGAVFRSATGYYENKRSSNLLKYKPTEEDKYIIVGIKQAISIEGEAKGMVGSFLVRAPDETNTFSVGAGKMNHNRRREIWEHFPKYTGKMLIVKHEELKTANDIPLCCVAVEVEE